jgi:hypothetical protein
VQTRGSVISLAGLPSVPNALKIMIMFFFLENETVRSGKQHNMDTIRASQVDANRLNN